MAASAERSSKSPRVDTSFAFLALQFLQSGDEDLLSRIADTGAARHLATHAQRVSTSGDALSARDLVERVLTELSRARSVDRRALGDRLSWVEKNRSAQARCWDEAAAFLPRGALSRTVLYLTVGYDIGVAVAGEASLNLAHPHFAEDREEIWFYCVHEVHHAGLQRYHDLPVLANVKTTSDLAELIRYLTTLEGLAVHAARGWRTEAGALQADADYAALLDPERMDQYEEEFLKLYLGLVEAPPRPLEEQDWEIVERMSSGDRLWYRVGARMADRLERALGREVLIETVLEGPDAFFSRYGEFTDWKREDAP
jgi:hypothetical protein